MEMVSKDLRNRFLMSLDAWRTAFENENGFVVKTWISRPGSVDADPGSNLDPLEVPNRHFRM